MKNCILSSILILTFFKCFAYGGCNDSPLAGMNEQIIKSAYDASDATIETKLEELKKMLQKTLESQNSDKKMLDNALVFQVDSIVSLRELDFLQRKDIQIEKQNEK